MADVQILAPGVSAAPLVYTVPGSREILLKTLYAELDGSGAAGAYYPTVRILSSAGKVVGEYRTQDSVPAGDSAHVTWGPFLGPKGRTVTFPRNVGELGFTGSGTLSNTYTHTIAFEDVQAGDGILVSAQAPTVPVALSPQKFPIGCEDSAGNFYNFIGNHAWQDPNPNVNEGAYQQFFYIPASIGPLIAGVDTITVTWTGAVYDRSVYAWLIRHDGGAHTPTELAFTPDNDAAVFASNQVTLTSPAWTPARDNALTLATLMAIKVGGVGGFGGVAGYSGYFQSQFRIFIGSKQQYLFNVATHGADVYLVVGSTNPQYEIDLGKLPGGVQDGPFNGVGQFYTAGANAWKGSVILGID